MDMFEFVLPVTRAAVSRGELDTAAWSDAHRIFTGSDTLTQQHFADEVDINTIVRRFGITGAMPFGPVGGVYGDFSGITDYESARAMIAGAEDRFLRLPPEVRERFGNDPGRLIEFASTVSEAEFEAAFSQPEVVAAEAVPAAVVPAVVP